ncbi:MAG: UDP-N-acetylmuramoyl-tripeptide--D-alanyl-D-alanine ligase [Planctomycetota bacterium]
MRVVELTHLDAPALAAVLNGELIRPGDGRRAAGVGHDTRTLEAGDLFFAIRGDRFDGHAFMAAAGARGAAGAVVSDPAAAGALPADRLVVRVADTTAALGRLAAHMRRTRTGLTVVGVTGSNGKTTSKELIRAALGRAGPTAHSPGNFNNHIGVPMSVLGIPSGSRYAVIEMGTEAPGEIAPLAAIARPDIAIVTNIGDTHLLGLGSRDGVAREKGHIYSALASGGTAVINLDTGFADHFRTLAPGPVVTYSMAAAADLTGELAASGPDGIVVRVNGRWDFPCRLPGAHNAANLLGALAVCRAAGLDPARFVDAFAGVVLPGMRMERRTAGGITFINDAYNANPQSMRAGIAFLGGLDARPGRKIFVCGDMRDLGPGAETLHDAVGRLITARTADLLITVGPLAAAAGRMAAEGTTPPAQVIACATVAEARQALAGAVRPGDTVYLKGSRSVGLEGVLEGRD